MNTSIIYSEILNNCIQEIQTARSHIALKINQTTISVYWNLGKLLSEKVQAETYGSGVINQLSIDLKNKFPDMGLSPRNLWNMKKFYERFCGVDEKLQRCVAVLPWRHILLIMSKTKTDDEAMFYSQKSAELGWSRDVLLNYMKANTFLLEENKNKSHNFLTTLPPEQSELAQDLLKNKYNLGFLGLSEMVKEHDLEKRLVEKIKSFILELGNGFSFIGNQYRLEFNDKEYFVDLLFFQRDLKSLVAIELKIGEFKPEYIGKMNFYLTLLDKFERKEGENNSAGIILCADKNQLDVEIALQDINKPIGVAEYELLIPQKQLKEIIITELKNNQ